MYTNQALWTMARERLNVVTILLSNRSYAILGIELQRVGAIGTGAKAAAMLSLDDPAIDWVKLAEAMGVGASRATTVAEFTDALTRALASDGPHLIEAMI